MQQVCFGWRDGLREIVQQTSSRNHHHTQDIQTEEQQAETYVLDEAGCPPQHAIPEYCRGKTRLKNVSVFDTCKELFDKHGWDPAALRACNLIE